MLVAETETFDEQFDQEIPTLNHSNLCTDIIEQILEDRTYKPLPELTLDIGNGLTPDISVYLRETIHPNYGRDVIRYPEMPLVAIEIVSPSQNIQTLLEKAETLIENGVKAVWTVEPFTNSIIITTQNGEQRFQNQEIESEGVRVDFKKIFGEN